MVELIFSAPFYTGVFLDSQRLVASGYRDGQRAIKERLGRIFPGRWHYPDASYGQDTVYSPVEGQERGATLVPRYFLGCTFDGACLREILERHELSTKLSLKEENIRWSWMIESVRLRLYEIGFGTIVVSTMAESLDSGSADRLGNRCDYEGLKENGERVSLQLNDFMALNCALISEFKRAAGDVGAGSSAVAKTGTSLISDDAIDFAAAGLERGRLLWTHRLFVLVEPKVLDEHEGQRVLRDRKEGAKKLLRQFHQQEVVDSAYASCEVAYLGTGNSVAVVPERMTESNTAGYISRVLQAAGIYDALMDFLHRRVFLFTNSIILKSRTSRGIRELQNLPRRVVRELQFVSHVAALRRQYVSHLEPQSGRFWDDLARAWRFPARWRDIEIQVGILERLYDRLSNDIAGRQQDALNRVALIFTVISGASALLYFLDISQRSDLVAPTGSIWVAIGIVLGMTAATYCLLRRMIARRITKADDERDGVV